MSNLNKSNFFNTKSSIDKRLEIISSELEIIKPDTLILNVDPNLESKELIDQIQTYHSMIFKEMIHLKHLENEEIQCQEKMKEKQEELENLLKPSQINYLSKDLKNNHRRPNSNEIHNKPVIDYKAKIRILEKELNYFNQCYNSTKANNEILINQLKELRKNTMNTKKKVKEFNEQLCLSEREFNENKEQIKKKIESNEDNFLIKEIQRGEKELKENTNLMIQELKSNDMNIAKKLAKEKYYEHELKKLTRKKEKIKKKWEAERKKFLDQMSEEIKKQNNFDPSSKLLDTIGKEKISLLEEMLRRFYEETNFNDIESLVDYFIKCSKEFKNFEEFLYKLSKNLENLEKEVDELEYIINFCQKNLEIKSEEIPDEDYKNQISLYRKSAEAVIHMQYYTINEVYKTFCEKLLEMFGLFFEGNEESLEKIEEVDLTEYVKNKLEKIQDRIKDIYRTMKENYNHNTEDNIKFDFSEVNNLYISKNEKIKDAVKKELDKYTDKGIRGISIEKIKSMVNPILAQQDKTK